jgi:hypothetical protein
VQEEIHLAGTFDGWDPESTPMRQDEHGVWRITEGKALGDRQRYRGLPALLGL